MLSVVANEGTLGAAKEKYDELVIIGTSFPTINKYSYAGLARAAAARSSMDPNGTSSRPQTVMARERTCNSVRSGKLSIYYQLTV